jgi:UDP-N-acetylmuramate dehydrogenase
MLAARDISIEHDAEVPTWFGIGGRARQLARPESIEDIARCLRLDPHLRILGDGANLLVDDEGVDELVLAFTHPAMRAVSFDQRDYDASDSAQHSSLRHTPGPAPQEAERGTQGSEPGPQRSAPPPTVGLSCMAGANLPKLILECVRLGLAGLEGVGGIPATVGGAVIMNAGGAFGQIGDVVARVHALDRNCNQVVLAREQIDFDYRRSGLNHLVITCVEFQLTRADPQLLRQRLKDVMAYKKSTQPMGEQSAGCVFKNPTLSADLEGIGIRGQRISAGLLLDRAGCKGMRQGGAEISHGHANFFITRPGARARDVIDLMAAARQRVAQTFGIALEPEIVIWRRT